MPILNFKGKTFVQNHHLAVKFHELIPDKDKSLTDKVSLEDNLIIHGDNLSALKSLLPNFAGRIKCIYIDPPYNTGNENWKYNDNVNSPMMQEWLGKVVDKDDLTRHDKWLCMMMPRLKLLKELLSDDGVIFISIDDNEVSNLKLLMDEIFGERNFVSCLAVQLNPRGRTLDRFIAKTHEYILLYAKDISFDDAINSLTKEGKAVAEYNKEDEKGKYRELELRNRNPVFNKKNRPNLFYPLYINPQNNKVSLEKTKEFNAESFPVNSQGLDGCWTWGKDKVENNINMLIGKKVSTGLWRVYRKDYLEKENGEVATTKAKGLWVEKEINNENGKEVVKSIFDKCDFDFPKSVELIKKCIKLGTNEDDIILDSFAGSGTTAHAILALNKEDGGNRKFILVECEDYANEITAERVRRVIKQGLEGKFSYFELGKCFDIDKLLAGEWLPSYKNLARYVFYTATSQEFKENLIDETTGFIGETEKYQVYLIYKPDIEYLKATPLNLDKARDLRNKTDKRLLIFAPMKYLDTETLDSLRIDFCQLPYEIYKIRG